MNEQSVKHYLNELGSKEGTPGGGSAAAYIGAMSAALSQMVLDIQKDKKEYSEYADQLTDLFIQSQALKGTFEKLAREDAVAFEPVLSAYKLPKDSPEQKKKRSETIEEAISKAAQPPLRMLENSLSVIGLLKQLTAMQMRGTIVNDLMVATLFIGTVLETAVLNVKINTKLLKDKEEKERLEKHAIDLLVSGKEEVAVLSEKIQYFLTYDKWLQTKIEEE